LFEVVQNTGVELAETTSKLGTVAGASGTLTGVAKKKKKKKAKTGFFDLA